MKKAKLLIPLVGSVAAISATVPAMVSCAFAQEEAKIICNGAKTATVKSNDYTEFKCKFNGSLTPFAEFEEGEGLLGAMVVPYQTNYEGTDELSEVIKFGDGSPPPCYAKCAFDQNGNFSFEFRLTSECIGQTIEFKFRFVVFNGDGIYEQVIDGFKYTVTE